jgi:hypothetical protein
LTRDATIIAFNHHHHQNRHHHPIQPSSSSFSHHRHHHQPSSPSSSSPPPPFSHHAQPRGSRGAARQYFGEEYKAYFRELLEQPFMQPCAVGAAAKRLS